MLSDLPQPTIQLEAVDKVPGSLKKNYKPFDRTFGPESVDIFRTEPKFTTPNNNTKVRFLNLLPDVWSDT